MVVKMPDILASIGVRKELPFTKFLNNELNKLRGSGVLQRGLVIPKQKCPLDEKLMPITFPKMVFLFAVFVLGGILSIFIFICETAISKKRRGKLEKNKQCKGQIISECPYEIIVCPKIATKKFPRFLP
jgi:hypothetical protein